MAAQTASTSSKFRRRREFGREKQVGFGRPKRAEVFRRPLAGWLAGWLEIPGRWELSSGASAKQPAQQVKAAAPCKRELLAAETIGRLSAVRLGSAQLGSAQPGSALLGSTGPSRGRQTGRTGRQERPARCLAG